MVHYIKHMEKTCFIKLPATYWALGLKEGNIYTHFPSSEKSYILTVCTVKKKQTHPPITINN